MFTIFTHSLRRYLWQILGWGITFGLVALYLMILYKPLVEKQSQMVALIQAYGANFIAFFGGTLDVVSPGGYLDFGFFSYIPIVAGIFALLIGSGLLVADEENGTLDLVLAHPISRAGVFWGRFLAFTVATACILLLTWIGFTIGIPSAGWKVKVLDLLLPHLTMFAILLLFGAIALFLSMALPSRTLAASITGALLVASYFITSLARVNDKLSRINNFSPLKYYQGGRALDGLDWQSLFGILGAALLFTMLAWLLFERRDIRVSGTSSWQLPAWLKMEWWSSFGRK